MANVDERLPLLVESVNGLDLVHQDDNRSLVFALVKTAMLIGSLLLGACKSPQAADMATSSQGSSTSNSALCQSISTLDRLDISRSDAFPQNQMRFSFSSKVAVANPTSVRKVAKALCALPKMPRSSINCPADFGITYHLEFFTGDREFPKIMVDSTGCASVDGIGPLRWVEQSPDFWHTLGVAMGLPAPDYATFRGSGPNQ